MPTLTEPPRPAAMADATRRARPREKRAAGLLGGCGEPSVREFKNRRELEALLTAVSLKNQKELDRDASESMIATPRASSLTTATKTCMKSSRRPRPATGARPKNRRIRCANRSHFLSDSAGDAPPDEKAASHVRLDRPHCRLHGLGRLDPPKKSPRVARWSDCTSDLEGRSGGHTRGIVQVDLMRQIMADRTRAMPQASQPAEAGGHSYGPTCEPSPRSASRRPLGARRRMRPNVQTEGGDSQRAGRLGLLPGIDLHGLSTHLTELDMALSQFHARGVQILAVSSDSPGFSMGRMRQYGEFQIPLLSDADRAPRWLMACGSKGRELAGKRQQRGTPRHVSH